MRGSAAAEEEEEEEGEEEEEEEEEEEGEEEGEEENEAREHDDASTHCCLNARLLCIRMGLCSIMLRPLRFPAQTAFCFPSPALLLEVWDSNANARVFLSANHPPRARLVSVLLGVGYRNFRMHVVYITAEPRARNCDCMIEFEEGRTERDWRVAGGRQLHVDAALSRFKR